jgi:hypothetical protein
MVDWIDGNLSASEVEALIAASGRSDIRQRVQQLQRNKHLLASLPQAAVPADLHDRVLAALERDALLGVSPEQWAQVEDSAQPLGTLPIDRLSVQHDASPAERARRAKRWWSAAPSLAMAASILLLVGGGALLYPTLRAAMQPTGARPNAPGTGNLARGSAHDAAHDAIGDAMSDSQQAASAGARAEAGATTDSQASTFGAQGTTDATLASEAAQLSEPIDSARALALAKEGRLIVRLLAKDAGALPRVEATATNPQSRLPWRLTREVPPAVVAAMMPKAPGEPAFASAAALRTRTESLLSSFASPAAALSMPSPQSVAQSKVRGTYVLDVQHSTLSLSQALDMLSKGLSASVQFEESPQALPLPRPQRSQDVLWWTQPSSSWTDRVAVPIIVQRG